MRFDGVGECEILGPERKKEVTKRPQIFLILLGFSRLQASLNNQSSFQFTQVVPMCLAIGQVTIFPTLLNSIGSLFFIFFGVVSAGWSFLDYCHVISPGKNNYSSLGTSNSICSIIMHILTPFHRNTSTEFRFPQNLYLCRSHYARLVAAARDENAASGQVNMFAEAKEPIS